jgi:type I restriction enzyme S subunit
VNDVRPLRAYVEVRLGRQRSPEQTDGPFMAPYLRAANVTDGKLALEDLLEMNFTPQEQAVFALRPSLSTSGETLTIEELLTLRARTENAGDGDDHERSTTGC